MNEGPRADRYERAVRWPSAPVSWRASSSPTGRAASTSLSGRRAPSMSRGVCSCRSACSSPRAWHSSRWCLGSPQSAPCGDWRVGGSAPADRLVEGSGREVIRPREPEDGEGRDRLQPLARQLAFEGFAREPRPDGSRLPVKEADAGALVVLVAFEGQGLTPNDRVVGDGGAGLPVERNQDGAVAYAVVQDRLPLQINEGVGLLPRAQLQAENEVFARQTTVLIRLADDARPVACVVARIAIAAGATLVEGCRVRMQGAPAAPSRSAPRAGPRAWSPRAVPARPRRGTDSRASRSGGRTSPARSGSASRRPRTSAFGPRLRGHTRCP